MYRSTNASRYPFSRPSGPGPAALGSLVAAAAIVAIIVACEHGRAPQQANGAIVNAPPAEPVALTPASIGASPAAPVVPPDVSYATAESAFRTRHYPVATEMFTAYTARRPENPWGYYMLGLSAWHAGQLDRAQHAFEGVLSRDPRHVKALVNLARVLLEENQAPDALTRINEALAIDSGLGEGWRRARSHPGATRSHRLGNRCLPPSADHRLVRRLGHEQPGSRAHRRRSIQRRRGASHPCCSAR